MKIKFSDLFNNQCRDDFKITIKSARDAIETPLDNQTFEHNGLFLEFYTKQIDQDTILLLIVQKEKEELVVQFGFKVKTNLMHGLIIRRPISILQNLIEKFGLPIKIGQMTKKIYLQEEVEIASLNNGNLLEVINPNNHRFITSSLIRVTKEKKVDCALTFALDKDEYLKWLIIS